MRTIKRADSTQRTATREPSLWRPSLTVAAGIALAWAYGLLPSEPYRDLAKKPTLPSLV